jgi:hypothetical protein
MRPTSIEARIYHGKTVKAFLTSVARAQAVDENAHVVTSWNLTRDLDLGDQKKIERETEEHFKELSKNFVTKCTHDSSYSDEYLDSLEKKRDKYLSSFKQKTHDVISRGATLDKAAQVAVDGLAVVKAASTITLAVAGAVATSEVWVPAFLIGAGYEVSLKVIKHWGKKSKAQLVAVAGLTAAKEGKKEALNQLNEGAGELGKTYFEKGAKKLEMDAAYFEDMIVERSKQLAAELTSLDMKKFLIRSRGSYKGKLTMANRGLAKANKLATSMEFVGKAAAALCVFKASYDAVNEMVGTWTGHEVEDDD